MRPVGARDDSGLVACLGDDPVGWCAVEPRCAYEGLDSEPTLEPAN